MKVPHRVSQLLAEAARIHGLKAAISCDCCDGRTASAEGADLELGLRLSPSHGVRYLVVNCQVFEDAHEGPFDAGHSVWCVETDGLPMIDYRSWVDLPKQERRYSFRVGEACCRHAPSAQLDVEALSLEALQGILSSTREIHVVGDRELAAAALISGVRVIWHPTVSVSQRPADCIAPCWDSSLYTVTKKGRLKAIPDVATHVKLGHERDVRLCRLFGQLMVQTLESQREIEGLNRDIRRARCAEMKAVLEDREELQGKVTRLEVEVARGAASVDELRVLRAAHEECQAFVNAVVGSRSWRALSVWRRFRGSLVSSDRLPGAQFGEDANG